MMPAFMYHNTNLHTFSVVITIAVVKWFHSSFDSFRSSIRNMLLRHDLAPTRDQLNNLKTAIVMTAEKYVDDRPKSGNPRKHCSGIMLLMLQSKLAIMQEEFCTEQEYKDI